MLCNGDDSGVLCKHQEQQQAGIPQETTHYSLHTERAVQWVPRRLTWEGSADSLKGHSWKGSRLSFPFTNVHFVKGGKHACFPSCSLQFILSLLENLEKRRDLVCWESSCPSLLQGWGMRHCVCGEGWGEVGGSRGKNQYAGRALTVNEGSLYSHPLHALGTQQQAACGCWETMYWGQGEERDRASSVRKM